jgi:hypothetical protein
MAAETDSLERRKAALKAFLETKVRQGSRVESQADTHAIIIVGGRAGFLQRFPFLSRFLKLGAGSRQAVSVDEHGEVTTTPAQPKRH